MFGHLTDQGNFGISEIENYKENECKEESITDISMSVHLPSVANHITYV